MKKKLKKSKKNHSKKLREFFSSHRMAVVVLSLLSLSASFYFIGSVERKLDFVRSYFEIGDPIIPLIPEKLMYEPKFNRYWEGM